MKNNYEEILNISYNERLLIIRALKMFKGKRKVAACALEITEKSLYNKISEYKIDKSLYTNA